MTPWPLKGLPYGRLYPGLLLGPGGARLVMSARVTRVAIATGVTPSKRAPLQGYLAHKNPPPLPS